MSLPYNLLYKMLQLQNHHMRLKNLTSSTRARDNLIISNYTSFNNMLWLAWLSHTIQNKFVLQYKIKLLLGTETWIF